MPYKGKAAVHLSKAQWMRKLIFFGFDNSGSEARSWARVLRFRGSELGSHMEKLGLEDGLRYGKAGLLEG